ncbi:MULTISPECIES: ABC transporter ATP-binding protein [unclassified Mesorhizobium]|uniref:ABC transporter ATP-binding protein n=1 Tax=unclassified Mesorhizobium TaxID=325217 RepID=UPI000FD3F0ED|nr:MULTISPECIES: ABC transporter ATP-binding protein [unclassified Mesorhizobium]RVB73362.1 ABC transporter ATP-binding protein [Mesorhizobium sp. M6A.T.Cr.TU.014.01.1.1]RWP77577.1 MAG: ABC transporter ATP-binding protein [Mesorhizobium sp.]RWQ02284.1 MAG: ABC transporter ATP-binding protein [Mesorhizobium sp.]RWQ10150.1 MAG: ABC transporter ATP-binding protein [Mesorhizobium sp.]
MSRSLPVVAVVKVEGLVRRFSGHDVLRGVDLDIRRGEFVALLGKSGSGKSTILRALAGLDDGADGAGRITVPPRRSVLFQDSRLLPWKSVIENVTLGLDGPDVRERALSALREVELQHRISAWPKTLSGGEQQRVALARSLVRSPDLLLADEPFSALDALTRIRMQRLLLELCRRHQPSVLFVTHDVEEALRLADRVLIISDGVVSSNHEVAAARTSLDRSEKLRNEILERLGVPFPIARPIDRH